MGKTIEELFKTKVLNDGVTAEKKYDIRNSKELPISANTTVLLEPSFRAATAIRQKISTTKGETRLEEETSGLRIINTLSAPLVYGTDIFRFQKKSTRLVEIMKDSVNTNNSQDAGIVGNFLKKAENFGLNIASKLGIAFPESTIPTKISLNSDFKEGKEPDTMITLAKIKGDSKGNLVGQLLKNNATGTPKQIGNQILGAGINLLKGEIKKKLFGAPKTGAQNLAGKSATEVQYDSTARYSDTISPDDEDYFKRNDLSSILVAKDTKRAASETAVINKVNELVPKSKSADEKNPLNVANNRFAAVTDKLKDKTSDITSKLSEGKKQGQQLLADGKLKIGDTKPDATATTPNPKIIYSDTVDETQDDIKLRNDLSSKLDMMNSATATMDTNQTSAERQTVTFSTYSSTKDSQLPKVSLKSKYGIDSNGKSDFLNEKVQYVGTEQKIGADSLDDYDFITLKFTSIHKNQSVNFRATLSGITETTTPTWDSAKFIGSPFPYWTYTGIERSVSFNFKVYSTTPLQHIAAWQRLNFLTSLAYPQGYNGGIAVMAPFIKITIGNLYKNKTCFISQLSYTVDDNGTWEVGPTAGMGMPDNQSFEINSEITSIDKYKLPKIIDVSVTLNLVESKSTTRSGYLYGFDKLPREVITSKDKQGKETRTIITNEGAVSKAEVSSDANAKTSAAQTTTPANTVTLPKADITPVTAAINTSGATKVTTAVSIGKDAKIEEAAKGGTKSEAAAAPVVNKWEADVSKGSFSKTYVTEGGSVLGIYTTPVVKYPGQFEATAYFNGGKLETGNRQPTKEAAVNNLEQDWLKGL
jgi:hypothetical protein